jgi:aminodeoxyfutalosine deaminase
MTRASDPSPAAHSAPNEAQVERIQGLAVIDAAGTRHQPGCLLVERPPGHWAGATESAGVENRLARILAVGSPQAVDTHPLASRAKRIDHPTAVLIPGLVNAHTHLDLTHLGPMDHDPEAGFVAWVDRIRSGRLTDRAEIAASVQLGIDRSLAGGTVGVGDIAGAVNRAMTSVPYETLAASPMLGVSFVEFFGIGASEAGSTERVEQFAKALAQRANVRSSTIAFGVRLGLQPHAPYTVGPDLYRVVARLARERGLPLSTHLAETPEEHAFIVEGTGPQRALLERLGLWDDAILDWAGCASSPVAHLASVLAAAPMVVAHANDASDADIETLSTTGTSVAYCPHASAYFDAPRHFGPHRYRDMLAVGVNVALGTDSIVNLPPEHAATRISVLDEMRLLHQRDGTYPTTLLAMATVNGACALGLDPAWFSFNTGSHLAGLVAVETASTADDLSTSPNADPLAAALAANTAPQPLLVPAS